jgi:hypothetical protein
VQIVFTIHGSAFGKMLRNTGIPLFAVGPKLEAVLGELVQTTAGTWIMHRLARLRFLAEVTRTNWGSRIHRRRLLLHG